jgi:hypothetical protein
MWTSPCVPTLTLVKRLSRCEPNSFPTMFILTSSNEYISQRVVGLCGRVAGTDKATRCVRPLSLFALFSADVFNGLLLNLRPEADFDPHRSVDSYVFVSITNGMHMIAMDPNGLSDPYCEVFLAKGKRKIKVGGFSFLSTSGIKFFFIS